jgi:hypothetical protein
LDAVWFCGCNVLGSVFIDNWLGALQSALKGDGIVFFTETRRFVTRHSAREARGIVMDAEWYPRSHGEVTNLRPVLEIFRRAFRREEVRVGGLGFIYYSKRA